MAENINLSYGKKRKKKTNYHLSIRLNNFALCFDNKSIKNAKTPEDALVLIEQVWLKYFTKELKGKQTNKQVDFVDLPAKFRKTNIYLTSKGIILSNIRIIFEIMKEITESQLKNDVLLRKIVQFSNSLESIINLLRIPMYQEAHIKGYSLGLKNGKKETIEMFKDIIRWGYLKKPSEVDTIIEELNKRMAKSESRANKMTGKKILPERMEFYQQIEEIKHSHLSEHGITISDRQAVELVGKKSKLTVPEEKRLYSAYKKYLEREVKKKKRLTLAKVEKK